jgi:hypothetical protein
MSPSFFVVSFASINDFTTDKTLYNTDDSIIISGNVDNNPDLFSIILQIITPGGSGLAHVDSIIPNNDGSFTKTINAGGPTWPENGYYTIKLSYGGNLEKSIEYQKSSEYVPPTSTPSTSTPSTSTPSTSTPSTSTPSAEIDDLFIVNPKMIIFGFPALDKSPQHYIDRYNNEPSYKSWFDNQFSFYDLEQVVGYQLTHIENFPALDKSPQHYIDRYNNEPSYKSWFDNQFPGKTIYSVLGFSTYIPDWIKDYARNWATGEISDNEFMIGLDFMIQNKIIVISGIDSTSFSAEDVPSWFRNTSHWWSAGLISQQEFINSIKYLIQEDIILIE